MIEIEDDDRLARYRRVGDPRWLEAQGLFVAEGRLVVDRVIAHGGYDIESILVTPAALRTLPADVSARPNVHVAHQSVVNGVTGFNFHRGCLALVRRPALPAPVAVLAPARVVVVLEGVGNPDNVGGIFRSAAALGADGILLDPSSGDPWYRKAVRTSMGAVLRLPFTRLEPWPAGLDSLPALGFTVAALSPAGALSVDQFAEMLTAESRIAFLAGAEGPGLSGAAMGRAQISVRIPVDPQSDSLNVIVAVSIALSRLPRVDTGPLPPISQKPKR